MPSIKDSFDSDSHSPPSISRRDENDRAKKKEKSFRGIAVPSGSASGFVRASALLRKAEPAEQLPGSLSQTKEEDVSQKAKRKNAKAVATSDDMLTEDYSQKPREDEAKVAAEQLSETQVYSRHFSAAETVPVLHATTAAEPRSLKCPAITESDDAVSPANLDPAKPKSFNSPSRPKVSKSPVKRKALTVTERAVQEFRPEEPPDNECLLKYFSPAVDEAMNSASHEAELKVKSKKRARKSTKRSSLLPPSDAIESLQAQKFIYNTSSQLQFPSSSPIMDSMSREAPKSPPESKLTKEKSFVDIDALIASSTIIGYRPTKPLWSAATRNEDGSLMAAEVIDLSESVFERDMAGAQNANSAISPQSNINILIDAERGRNISNASTTTELAARMGRSIPILPRSLGEAATRQRQASKSPVKKKRKTKENQPPKPEDDFKKVPLDDLKEELKGFGHKPPRSRKKIVELILLCRSLQTQNQALTTLSEPVEHSTVPGAHTEPLTSASMEMTSKEAPDIAIIHRVTTVAVSSQTRTRQITATPESADNLPPPSFQTPAKASQESVDGTQTAMLLLSAIHQAIISQPATHSIANPSWKEKIAMYDPIVLEELTTWLNTGGLDAVGIDTEVWPALVRDWCESKSVCFVWASEGWRKKR